MSVSSALIRASRALCLLAAILYVGKCSVAALCQEKSSHSQNLDFPISQNKRWLLLCRHVLASGTLLGIICPMGVSETLKEEGGPASLFAQLHALLSPSLHSLKPRRSC